MARIGRSSIQLTLVILGLLPLSSAAADALPLSRRVELGSPLGPVDISVLEQSEGVVLEMRVGARRVRRELDISSAREASIELVDVAANARVAILRVRAEGGSVGALLVARRGRPAIAWLHRLDPQGDPGEGSGWEIRAVEAGAHRSVVAGEFDEGLGLCGSSRFLRNAQRLDVSRMRMVRSQPPALLPEAAAADEALGASATSPGPHRPPRVRGLRFETSWPSPSASLQSIGDRDPETRWSTPAGAGWAFIRARWIPPGRPLRAIAFFGADPEEPMPDEIWLVGDEGRRIRVQLSRPTSPRAPIWYVPEAPLEWRCVSIAFERSEDRGLGFSEIWAYSDLDFEAGLGTLVADLSAGGQRARAAARLLSSMGPDATAALLAAWPDMPSVERRLTLGVLGAHARRFDEGRAALVEVARSSDEPMGRAALELLLEAGEPGLRMAATLIPSPTLGAPAGRELARRAPTLAIGPLLSAIEEADAERREDLRESLGTAFDRGGPPVLGEASAWSERAHPALARTQVALALTRRGADAEALALRLHGLAADASSFEERWYLLQIAAAMPPSESLAAWTVSLARGAEEWMLRAGAIDALPRLDRALAVSVARQALSDPYPRVRVAAVKALGALEEADEAVGALAVNDAWPLVRARAVEALASNEAALPVIRAAVRDAEARVRAAAVATLAAIGDRESWPLVRERLESGSEQLTVLRAAMAYVSSLCLHEAVPILEEIIDRGQAPGAREARAQAGVAAIVALGELGGDEARRVLTAAASSGGTSSLEATARQALTRTHACGAATTP